MIRNYRKREEMVHNRARRHERIRGTSVYYAYKQRTEQLVGVCYECCAQSGGVLRMLRRQRLDHAVRGYEELQKSQRVLNDRALAFRQRACNHRQRTVQNSAVYERQWMEISPFKQHGLHRCYHVRLVSIRLGSCGMCGSNKPH